MSVCVTVHVTHPKSHCRHQGGSAALHCEAEHVGLSVKVLWVAGPLVNSFAKSTPTPTPTLMEKCLKRPCRPIALLQACNRQDGRGQESGCQDESK